MLEKSGVLSEILDEDESRDEVSPLASVRMDGDELFAELEIAAVVDELENNRCWVDEEFGLDDG